VAAVTTVILELGPRVRSSCGTWRSQWPGELSSRALGGDGGHRGRRDRRDRGNGIPLGSAVAAVTTVIVEPRPAQTLIWWGEGLAVDESVTIA
jgi:hypothetical protein